MKKIASFAFVLYMLAKRGLQLIDAYAVLFIINFGAKIFQFKYIFTKLDKTESFICMFGFRVVFGLLLLVIYDFIGRNLFELEGIDQKINQKERNSFLEKIYNQAPWFKRFLNRMKNSIIQKINKVEWLEKFILYCKRALWVKKIIHFIGFISLNLIEPGFMVIISLKGKKKYIVITKFNILKNYVIGSLLCSMALYTTFSILHKVTIF